MLNDHLFIVMAIEHYNTLGVIRSLGEKGFHPIYIAIKGKLQIASKSKYISKCHYVDNVEDGYKVLLSEYGKYDENHKPFVFFSDDRTLGYVDSHFDEMKDRFIFFNAGEMDRINRYMDKEIILEMAKECGVRYARTVVCERGEIPEGIIYPIITKSISPNVGGWKADVFVCENEEELKCAYEKIKAHRVLLQEYIEKKTELELYGISINHGKDVIFTVMSDYLYTIRGYYSPYMLIYEPTHKDVQKNIAEMIRKIGFEGLFTAEFLVDKQDNIYFTEINFRNCCWNYASTVAGFNLQYLWAKGMIEGVIDVNDIGKFAPFKAMVEPIDYAKRVKGGIVSFAEWISDFKEAKLGYYCNKDDIEPWKVCIDNWDRLG